jgi:hypothetical protein
MKSVMIRAWEIAEKTSDKFGGKKSEYFAGALKMAWEQYRKENRVHKMVVIGNKDNGKYTIERYMGTECVQVVETTRKREYFSLYQSFYKRGAHIIDFYVIENGVKVFKGTKTA